MNTKVALRKEAVRLYWQEGLSKAEISRRLKTSRRWVVRWLARYDHERGGGLDSVRVRGDRRTADVIRE